MYLSLIFAELLPFAALGCEAGDNDDLKAPVCPKSLTAALCRSSLYLFLMVC